jgi:hypothetical protein
MATSPDDGTDAGNGRAVSRQAGRLLLSSEFGSVALEVDTRANGPRLRIENQHNRRVIYLDPLEVASLTWLTHERLGPFLDPSQTGWSSNDEGA